MRHTTDTAERRPDRPVMIRMPIYSSSGAVYESIARDITPNQLLAFDAEGWEDSHSADRYSTMDHDYFNA